MKTSYFYWPYALRLLKLQLDVRYPCVKKGNITLNLNKRQHYPEVTDTICYVTLHTYLYMNYGIKFQFFMPVRPNFDAKCYSVSNKLT